MAFKKISSISSPNGSPPAPPRPSDTPTSTLPSVTTSAGGLSVERDPRPIWQRPVEDNTARLGVFLARLPGCYWTTLEDVTATWIWIGGRHKVLALKEDASTSEIEEMLRVAEASIGPAPKPEIVKLLTKVYFTTSARKEGDDDLRMRFGVWADELGKLPGDAVREALDWWSQNQKWWPSLSEVRAIVYQLGGGHRAATRDRLRKLLQERSKAD
jgi:hypothetical protein